MNSRFKDIANLKVGSGCVIEDYIYIYGLVSLIRPITTVEIGTNLGVSAIAMGLALKENSVNGKIYTFEIARKYVETAKSQVKKMGLEDYINCNQGTSDNVKNLNVKHFDFAFVDGNHTFDWVSKDFKNLKNICNYILFHDLRCNSDVKRFINELQGEKILLIEKSHGNVYNLGKFHSKGCFSGFALWRNELYKYEKGKK